MNRFDENLEQNNASREQSRKTCFHKISANLFEEEPALAVA